MEKAVILVFVGMWVTCAVVIFNVRLSYGNPGVEGLGTLTLTLTLALSD